MDNADRAKLDEAHRIAHKAHDLAEKSHDALFTVPPGSDQSERPLISWLRSIVKGYRGATWAVRALIWLPPSVGGAIFATVKILEFLKGGGP